MMKQVGRGLLLMPWLLVMGCQPSAPPPSAAPPAPAKPVADAPKPADAPADGKIRIAVVPKATALDFWNTVKAGAEAAGKENNVEVTWKGGDDENDTNTQKAILEDFVTAKYSAIVMAATSEDALVPTLQKAEAAGVPVITIDSGVKWDKVRSFVATDNVAGAQKGGEKLIELIGGQGDVGCLPFIKGANSSEDREKGFKQAVDASGGKVKLVSTLWSRGQIGEANRAVGDMLTANPNIKGIFAANEPGVIGAANALVSAKQQGKVKLVGFDGSAAEVEKLKAGVVQALVLQDPFKMGHEGVMQALKAIKGEKCDARVDTGVFVLTMDNINSPRAQELLKESGALDADKKADKK